MIKIRQALAIGLLLIGPALGSDARPDGADDPGKAPAAPEATAPSSPLAQYEFLIGDWDVAVTLRRPAGKDFSYDARWHNHWVANGNVVMQEWMGPYVSGIELRSYSSELKKWVGRNVYMPDPGVWYENTAELVDGEMVVTTHRVNQKGEEAITREIYHDILPDHFAIRTEESADGGRTWQKGRYEAVMTRAR